MKKILVVLSCLTLCSLLTHPVYAADVSLVISPPRYDVEGKPGEIVQKNIKITNNSIDQELILRAFTVDFIVQDDAGTPIKVSAQASGRYLASPWFSLERDEIVLPPKTTEQLSVMITIPPDALPGGHYAGVFFEPVPRRGLKTTVSYTATQVGSLFGITIPGDIKYDALIKSFTAPNVSEFGPVELTAVVENQSDTHIRPVGTITIHNMIGRQIDQITLDEVNIFPFASRTLKGTWDQVWGMGRYMATLSLTYGPGLVVSRTIYFWVLPYRLLAALAVVILVMLVVIIVTRRHLKHREDTRDSEIEGLRRKIAEMENRHQ